MWTARVFGFCICTVCLLDISCAVTKIGYEAEDVTFHVRYSSHYEENIKYFGRSDGFFFEKLVQTTESNMWTRRGRFALLDNTSKHFLTATIFELISEDSGMYTFGVDVKMLPDPDTQILLTVRRRSEPQKPTTSLPRVVVSSTNSPANITTQNWAEKGEQGDLSLSLCIILYCLSFVQFILSFIRFVYLSYSLVGWFFHSFWILSLVCSLSFLLSSSSSSSLVGSPGMELDIMFPQLSILGDADDHFCFLFPFDMESYLRFVTVLSLVCVGTLLLVCPFALFKVFKWATTCKLSVSVSYHTRTTSDRIVDEYLKMTPVVLSKSSVAQRENGSFVEDFHRLTNTQQTHSKDANYIDPAPADSLDQIYTEMNPGFAQESIYYSIDQITD
ncbi:uncharacterized protein LOC143710435 isoform X2 [Siphateles boraxobius]|uniref:uncharacterized protein LOC143710435 isoform X2 n=1 Tax=Siphateles boraxobius TaxID=180520 RepID=UPI0040649F89